MTNLTRIFSAWKDKYAKTQKDWILRDDETITLLGDWQEVFANLDRLVSRGVFFHLIVRSQTSGRRHQIVCRRGVHDSKQDGPVQGNGVAMTDPTIGNFGTWVCVYDGPKVNTGAGKGYRTWNAGEVFAIRVKNAETGKNETALTATGMRYYAEREARHAVKA